jgi:hypothetical protein
MQESAITINPRWHERRTKMDRLRFERRLRVQQDRISSQTPPSAQELADQYYEVQWIRLQVRIAETDPIIVTQEQNDHLPITT